MNEVYTIDCPKCGVIYKNSSPLYCDCCEEPVDRIKFGCFWYNIDELEEDSMY